MDISHIEYAAFELKRDFGIRCRIRYVAQLGHYILSVGSSDARFVEISDAVSFLGGYHAALRDAAS